MNLKFRNKVITGILTVLPNRISRFEDEIGNYNFTIAQSMKLKKVMGYNSHRIVDEGTTIVDLSVFALNYAFENHYISKEDINALVLVTQTPDYILPPSSNIIQGKVGLSKDIICLDINQGCAGYEIGLFQAFMLLEQESINKVILLNTDVLSQRVSKQDRGIFPLIGDAAALTVIERSKEDNIIYGNIKMDGILSNAVVIPAGGFKLPSDDKTAELFTDQNGNIKSLNHMSVNGDVIFNFVQREVPPMIEDLLRVSGESKDNIDYFMFHQTNKFTLSKLAERLKIPQEKLPNNICELFGNSNGVTVPVSISYNLGKKLVEGSYNLCLAGFGVGLAWASILLKVNKLDFNEIIYY